MQADDCGYGCPGACPASESEPFKLDTVAKALGVSLEITIVQWMMPDVRQRFCEVY